MSRTRKPTSSRNWTKRCRRPTSTRACASSTAVSRRRSRRTQSEPCSRSRGVVAVQADTPRPMLTDSSNEFIGSPTIWDALGGQSTAGSGTLFASLDSGAWPEHPSFAANPALPAAPTDTSGDPLDVQLRRQPADPTRTIVRVQQQARRRRTFPRTPTTRSKSARCSPTPRATATVTAPTRRRPRPATQMYPRRSSASSAASSRASHPGRGSSTYKVCGAEGCFPSDSIAAVQQGLLDGIDVINYSIGGGGDPFIDPVELAFLDAYAAGVFVSASAGNDGPDASTIEHLGPWVTTVGASTQTRDVHLAAHADRRRATLTLTASSITEGIDSAAPGRARIGSALRPRAC